MAEKEKDKEIPEEGDGKEKGKKSKGKLILILSLSFLLLGGGGFAVYKLVLDKPQAAEVEKTEKKSGKQDLEKIVGTMVPLDTFLVNIDDGKETRFLKTTLTLELENEDLQEEITKRMPQIRDTILLLLSSKHFSDIRSFDGKYILREEILDQLNGILVTGRIKNVYFTEFVVQ